MSGGVTIPCLLLVSPPQTDGRQPLQFSGLANEADVRSELGNVPVLMMLCCRVLQPVAGVSVPGDQGDTKGAVVVTGSGSGHRYIVS